jgi:hypothetical protein
MTVEGRAGPSEGQRRALMTLAAVFVAFAIGAGWQFMRADGLARELREARRELTFYQLEARLGAASLEAQRGSHEVARRLAAGFFDGLQAVIATTPDAARRDFSAVLERRDDVITGLSRADPSTGIILADLFLRWRTGMAELIREEGWREAGDATP